MGQFVLILAWAHPTNTTGNNAPGWKQNTWVKTRWHTPFPACWLCESPSPSWLVAAAAVEAAAVEAVGRHGRKTASDTRGRVCLTTVRTRSTKEAWSAPGPYIKARPSGHRGKKKLSLALLRTRILFHCSLSLTLSFFHSQVRRFSITLSFSVLLISSCRNLLTDGVAVLSLHPFLLKGTAIRSRRWKTPGGRPTCAHLAKWATDLWRHFGVREWRRQETKRQKEATMTRTEYPPRRRSHLLMFFHFLLLAARSSKTFLPR